MAFDWAPLPLATSLGKGAAEWSSAMELRNLMLVRKPPGEARPFGIRQTPVPASPFATDGTVRGMVSAGELFWIQGSKAYFFDGTENEIDTLPGTPIVFEMCAAGPSQCLAAGEDGGTFLIDGASVTAITHPEMGGIFSDVDFLNGKALYVDPTGKLYVSAVDDPETIDPLSFTVADAVADSLVAVAVCNQEAALMGVKHTEFWYDAGGFPFPLSRSPSGVVAIGCYSPHSVAVGAQIFFLDNNLQVRRFNGYQPDRISTDWVERLIREHLEANEFAGVFMRGHVHTFEGHAHYGLSLPSDDFTTDLNLMFDLAEGVWHLRGSGVASSYRHVITHQRLGGQAPTTFAALNSKVYELSSAAYRDPNFPDDDREHVITCPAHDANGRRDFEAACELAMLNTGEVEGTVKYEFSDDGGETFESLGTVPTDQDVKRWDCCGSYTDRRIRRFTVAVNAPVEIDALRGLIEVGE